MKSASLQAFLEESHYSALIVLLHFSQNLNYCWEPGKAFFSTVSFIGGVFADFFSVSAREYSPLALTTEAVGAVSAFLFTPLVTWANGR